MLNVATKFVPLERDAFERAWQAGFRCAELWLGTPVLEAADRVIALAHAYPFRYAVHFPNRSDLSPDDLSRVVRIASDLACRTIVIHRPQYEKFARDLRGALPGVALAVENHRLDPQGLAAWRDEFDELTLDVEHLWMFTWPRPTLPAFLEALDEFFPTMIPKLRHVHLPGHLPGWGEHRPMYCARELVFAMFDRLEASAFQGLIVSEADSPYQTPQDLRMDVLLFDLWRTRHAHPTG